MSWCKPKRHSYPRVLVHDSACQQNPCLCLELRELRYDKERLALMEAMAKRYDMARKLLEGE